MKLADNASIGIIETKGLVGAVAAADAMVKAASVALFRKHYPGSARVTLMCQGELSACEAAVYAGTREAEAVGELIASTVIGRPDFGAEELCLGCIDEAMERKKARKAAAHRELAHVSTPGKEAGQAQVLPSEPEPGEDAAAARGIKEAFRIADAAEQELDPQAQRETPAEPEKAATGKKTPSQKKKPKPDGSKR